MACSSSHFSRLEAGGFKDAADLSRYVGIATGIRRPALGNRSQSRSAFFRTYPYAVVFWANELKRRYPIVMVAAKRRRPLIRGCCDERIAGAV